MNKHTIYLALGTNLGDKTFNLKDALQSLPPQIEVISLSRLYETAPAYVLDQPAFLNMAVQAGTNLSPLNLLLYLQQIETQIGREKSIRYGPREIDLDIIFYDDLILELPDLQIPHKRMQERGFVLRPLLDIAPDLIHPVLKKSITQLVDELPPDDGVLTVL